jgi:hypothetical protein
VLQRCGHKHRASLQNLDALSYSVAGCLFPITPRLTDYDGVRLCLRTAATNGPIVHPPGDMWAWRAMVVMMMMMPAGDNSWLVHQIFLAFLPTKTSEASRRNGRRSESFAYQCQKYLKGSGFTSHWKEGMQSIFIALKIHLLGRVWTRSGKHTNYYTTEATRHSRPINARPWRALGYVSAGCSLLLSRDTLPRSQKSLTQVNTTSPAHSQKLKVKSCEHTAIVTLWVPFLTSFLFHSCTARTLSDISVLRYVQVNELKTQT